MVGVELQSYFMRQQVAPQWLPVLRALALTLADQADPSELHSLFFDVGTRLATDAGPRVEQLEYLEQLQDELNQFWGPINWGWVELVEVQGAVAITHHAAPLAQAFGAEALAWSVGLLEGYYQSVFQGFDSEHSMALRSVGEVTDGLTLCWHFGQATGRR